MCTSNEAVAVVEVLHRRVALAGVRVVEDEVAVRERAALGVLAGQPDGIPSTSRLRERERLGLAPVDAALVERRRRGARAAGRASGGR